MFQAYYKRLTAFGKETRVIRNPITFYVLPRYVSEQDMRRKCGGFHDVVTSIIHGARLRMPTDARLLTALYSLFRSAIMRLNMAWHEPLVQPASII